MAKLKTMLKPYFLVSLGIVNLLHGGLHLYQFVMSMLWVSTLSHIETVGSMIGSLVIGLFGVISLWIGISDYIHHKNCIGSRLK